jgi:hypothetical protein
MTKQYFIRAKLYKKPVTGTIIEHNGRTYGIHKEYGEWTVTDILTGLKLNTYKVDTRTKQKAIDYIQNFDITQYKDSLKEFETAFNSLPEYDPNKVYITNTEWRNNETCYYEGEYKGKKFETTLSIYKIGYEVDYFEGEFSADEETEITEQITNCKNKHMEKSARKC